MDEAINTAKTDNDIMAYLEVPEDTEVMGKRLMTKKTVRLSLTKPKTDKELMLVHIPVGSNALRQDNEVVLPPGTVLYAHAVTGVGEYFGSLQRKIRFSCSTNKS